MNGENELSLKEKIDKIVDSKKEKIDDFEQRIGFPAYQSEIEECKYLNLKPQDLKGLTPEKCGEIAAELASYGFYIQRTLNHEKSILRFLNSKIDSTIIYSLNDFSGYYSTDQRRMMAIVNNEAAKYMEDIRITHQIKVDCLEQIPFQINQLCRTILEIKKSKTNGQTNY